MGHGTAKAWSISIPKGIVNTSSAPFVLCFRLDGTAILLGAFAFVIATFKWF
jgi:hypothetical protein